MKQVDRRLRFVRFIDRHFRHKVLRALLFSDVRIDGFGMLDRDEKARGDFA